MPAPFIGVELTKSQLEERRARVLSLRLRKLTEAAIAGIVQVSEPTVCRDLQWIAKNWSDRFDTPGGLDSAGLIGESIALYQECETNALMEFTVLQQDAQSKGINPMYAARQRMACLRTAMMARELQVNMLMDLGKIVPAEAGKTTVPLAETIRAVVQRIRTAPYAVMSDAEREARAAREAQDKSVH